MTALYRGCEIKSERGRALGGWSQVYWSAFRQSDHYEIISGFGGGSVREMLKQTKHEVDFFVDRCGGDVARHRKHFFRNL